MTEMLEGRLFERFLTAPAFQSKPEPSTGKLGRRRQGFVFAISSFSVIRPSRHARGCGGVRQEASKLLRFALQSQTNGFCNVLGEFLGPFICKVYVVRFLQFNNL